MELTGRSPVRWLLDLLSPPGMARRRIEREASDHVERLLHTNATRVMNDLDERVLENHLIDQTQYTILVTVVIGSAVVPTLIAQSFFQPEIAAPPPADRVIVAPAPAPAEARR